MSKPIRFPQSGKRSNDPIINILRDGRFKALGYRDEYNLERYDKAVSKEVKALFIELISELNGGDWRKPINSDELRQKIDIL